MPTPSTQTLTSTTCILATLAENLSGRKLCIRQTEPSPAATTIALPEQGSKPASAISPGNIPLAGVKKILPEAVAFIKAYVLAGSMHVQDPLVRESLALEDNLASAKNIVDKFPKSQPGQYAETERRIISLTEDYHQFIQQIARFHLKNDEIITLLQQGRNISPGSDNTNEQGAASQLLEFGNQLLKKALDLGTDKKSLAHDAKKLISEYIEMAKSVDMATRALSSALLKAEIYGANDRFFTELHGLTKRLGETAAITATPTASPGGGAPGLH